MMCNSNLKILVFIFIISVLLFILISPMGAVGVSIAAITTCIVFQAFTTIVINKFQKEIKPIYLFVVILFGGSIIDLLIRICYFEDTLSTLPVFLGRVIAVITGYLVFKLIIKK